MIMSCKASYTWCGFQVFQSTYSPYAGIGIENLILRPKGVFFSCIDYSCNVRYFYTGEWEKRQDSLVLYPRYQIDTENPEYPKKLVQPDTMRMSDCWLDYGIPRVFLIRRRFLQEVTDYSRELYVNRKMEKYKDYPEQRRIIFRLTKSADELFYRVRK